VLVEAAQLETDQSHEPSGSACALDIEFQTADTARLERVFDDPELEVSTVEVQIEDTIEIEPIVIDAETDATPIEASQVEATVAESDESPMTQTQNQPRANFDGALLDLDESDFGATSLADDVLLDLDFEEPVPPQQTTAIEDATPAPIQLDDALVTTPEVMSAEETQAQAIVVLATPEVVNDAAYQDQTQAPSISETLSAQTIDAIARRVMDQMSD